MPSGARSTHALRRSGRIWIDILIFAALLGAAAIAAQPLIGGNFMITEDRRFHEQYDFAVAHRDHEIACSIARDARLASVGRHDERAYRDWAAISLAECR